ncbi:ABC transporter substrate-binding protein [Caballeronia sp. LZ062]|uniref:ABC transporter substrate-binding protein n=1 Tax=unclassified Caballeronia TaxID=2646786 RepID=UPI00285C9314|nr:MULTISPECIES: ABC transporter substrate-binding protein [unclassified Caballeronia]MDR5857740.1 ABC transporter substrate-binding protein [Caballeronia sp. LZ050]MDR5869290.1 ABC transporter substrate-binding protein [Caballeronia sp. LZ062]
MPFGARPSVRAFVVALALCAAQAAHAQPIRLMTGGAAKLVYLPVILADRLGYFRSEGLDVRVMSSPAGIDVSTELVAGAIQGAVGYYDHAVALQSRGMDVQSVIVLGQSAGVIELARNDDGARAMRTLADARGRKLGVTGFGSSTYVLTRYLAKRAGVASDAYTVVPLPTEAAFEQAIVSGAIDAGMTEEPTATRLMSRGAARALVDLRGAADTRARLGGSYVGPCVYMRREWIDAHPDETGRLVRAVHAALRFIQTHDEAEIEAAVPASLKGGDTAGYRHALAVMKPAFSPTGRMPPEAPPTALAILSEVDADVSPAHIDLSRTWTDRFVDAAQ